MTDVSLSDNVLTWIISVVEFFLRSPAARTSGLLMKKLGLPIMDKLTYPCVKYFCIWYLWDKLELSGSPLLFVIASYSDTTGYITCAFLSKVSVGQVFWEIWEYFSTLEFFSQAIVLLRSVLFVNYISGKCIRTVGNIFFTLKIFNEIEVIL